MMKRLLQSKSARLWMGILLFLLAGAVVFPVLSPFDYATQNVIFSYQPPLSLDPVNGGIHWFGTDSLGRDIFTRLWYGARISFVIALVAALIDCVVGVLYGGIAGYLGGRVDTVMMRVLEVISGVPYLIVVLLMLVVFPRGPGTIILAYALVGWTQMARLIRGQVIALCQREFIVIAKTMGASPWRVIFRHLIPNLQSVIIVNVTLDVPSVIFTEAFLSMLGLGIAPPRPSLGILASEGVAVFQMYPAQLIFSAGFICLTMLAFNLLGDRLQETLNPRQRRNRPFGEKGNPSATQSVD